MSSGVIATDDCISSYKDLKLSRKYRYLVYRISDDAKQITIEKTASPSDHTSARAAYDAFVGELPKEDCRYAVFDYEYEKAPGEGMRSKIVFVAWSPDVAKVKSKMLYASSKDALRKKLEGIATEVQATEPGEIAYEAVLEKVKLF